MLDTLSSQEVDAIHIFIFKRTAPTQMGVYKKSRFFQEVNALARAGEKWLAFLSLDAARRVGNKRARKSNPALRLTLIRGL
jgi:hypothetical protein